MFQHNMNYISAVNALRGTMGVNPQHNQHIQQIAQCVQDAFAANNLPYDMSLWELRQTVKRQQQEIDELKSRLQAVEKQTPPTSTPIPADIFITPQSISKVRNDLRRMLN